MTPNTPASGAVAWRHVYFRDGKRIGIGPWRGIGERINEQQGDDIEYAYTTPPATVSADAVLALVEKLNLVENFADGLRSFYHGDYPTVSGRFARVAKRIAEIRDELEAALAAAQEPAGGGEDAEIQAYREFHLAVDSALLGADALQIDHEGDYRAAIANTIFSIRRLATPTPQSGEACCTMAGTYSCKCNRYPAPASPQGVSEEMVTAAIRRYLELEPGEKEVGGVTPESTETRRFVRELLEAAFGTAAGAAPEGWQPKAQELLDRLAKASPPNVLHQQLTILGDMAALLRCMYPNPGAQENKS